MSLSKNELCYDIMEMIGKQYTIIKETNKNKKLYGEIVKHLEYYIDEYVDYRDENGTFTPRPIYIRYGDKRTDTNFLEYEELWCSNHYEIIADKHGGQDYDDWCDAWF